MKKLYIFDCDGTLVEKYTDILLPGVLEWFQAVDWSTTACAIATNQGGVGLRYWMVAGGFGDPLAYPTETDVFNRLVSIREKLTPAHKPSVMPIWVSYAYQSKRTGEWGPTPYGSVLEGNVPDFWRKEWRKPSPGMLIQSMLWARVSAGGTVFVGDRGEDEQAAANAGVKFVQADEFFGRGKP